MQIQLEQHINAPAEKAWQKLGPEFSEISAWANDVTLSRALSADEIPAGIKVANEAPVPGRYTESRVVKAREVLVEYSDSQMMFTFHAVGLPKFISRTSNTTRVVPTDNNSCTVTFDIQIDFKGIAKVFAPIMKKRLSSSGPGKVIRELKELLEKEAIV